MFLLQLGACSLQRRMVHICPVSLQMCKLKQTSKGCELLSLLCDWATLALMLNNYPVDAYE